MGVFVCCTLFLGVCAMDLPGVTVALLISLLVGTVYFGLLSYFGVPLFYVAVFDGSLMALFFMENTTLMSDLEQRIEPDAALLRSDKLQREMIKQLSSQRAVLQKQLLDLGASVRKKKGLKGDRSRSCGDMYGVP